HDMFHEFYSFICLTVLEMSVCNASHLMENVQNSISHPMPAQFYQIMPNLNLYHRYYGSVNHQHDRNARLNVPIAHHSTQADCHRQSRSNGSSIARYECELHHPLQYSEYCCQVS